MDTCLNCPNIFRRKYIAKGKRKVYCSRQCALNAIKKVKHKKTCKTCLCVFYAGYNRKRSEYCSRACIERHPCQLCGKIITGRVTFQSGQKRFCTRKCSNIFHRTLRSQTAYVARGFANSIKKHGKIKCQQCDLEEISCLCVHHIDENRENNSPENLQTLCYNCHARLHWEDSANRLQNIQVAHAIAPYL